MLATTRYSGGHGRLLRGAAFALALAATLTAGIHNARAQTADEPALKTGDELQTLVGPIALYPDDLVAIVLPAATYPLQIVQAARFLDAHEADPDLTPSDEWDDAIVALLNYPEVVRMMNEDLDWTWALGQAVLNQETDVIDAIQSFRDRAYAAGNLQSDSNQTVSRADGDIEIAPADPQVVRIPYYEPEAVVVHRPVRIYYYPTAYPLYYYPYPAGYWFGGTYFFGVTSAFTIGWYSHDIHVYAYTHVNHPYYARYRRGYYHPYYTRQARHDARHDRHNDYVWTPNDERRGDRPRSYRAGERDGAATPQVRASHRDSTRLTSHSGTIARSRSDDTARTTRPAGNGLAGNSFAGNGRTARTAPPRSDTRQSHPSAPARAARAARPPRASTPARTTRPGRSATGSHSTRTSPPAAQPARPAARPAAPARQTQRAAPARQTQPAARAPAPSSRPAPRPAPAAPRPAPGRGRGRLR